MPNLARAITEPQPAYMRHPSMRWARFIEGEEGAPPVEPAATPAPVDEKPDEALGDNGKKALEAEREARKAAEKLVAEYKAREDAAESAKLSDIERATKERDDAKAEAATARVELSVRKLASQHGINSEDDITVLLAVSDEKARETLAARLAPKPDEKPRPAHVPKAGSSSADSSGPTGSMQAGRDLYAARKAAK